MNQPLAAVRSASCRTRLAYGFVVLLFLLNLLAFAYQARSIIELNKNQEDYSYVGTDHPQTLQINLDDPVTLVIKNSNHFKVNGPLADEDWDRLLPPGRGFVHLGANYTRFGLTMFHQLHCLWIIRVALQHGITEGHVHHCLVYLRQTILCAADVTLEPGVPELGPDWTGELAINGINVQHTCRDWSRVWSYVTTQFHEWETWKSGLNVSMTV